MKDYTTDGKELSDSWNNVYREGLRVVVCHPEFKGIEFYMNVRTPLEGLVAIDALAVYELFLGDKGLMPDHSNVMMLEVYNTESQEWEDWMDEYGNTIDSIDVDI